MGVGEHEHALLNLKVNVQGGERRAEGAADPPSIPLSCWAVTEVGVSEHEHAGRLRLRLSRREYEY